MKKNMRRLLSACLAFVLCISVPSMAFATSSVSWDDGLRYCTAIATKGDEYQIAVPIASATILEHTFGENGIITWPLGYRATQEPVHNGIMPGTDRVYIYQALDAEGVEIISMTANMATGYETRDYYVLDPALPDGQYSYGSEFTVYDAEWSVVKGELTGWALILPTEGTIEGIPVSCTDTKLIVMLLD